MTTFLQKFLAAYYAIDFVSTSCAGRKGNKKQNIKSRGGADVYGPEKPDE